MITARTVAKSRWTFIFLIVASMTAIWALLRSDTVGAQLNGDVNLDGHVNSLDAAIILQYDAGLISSLRQKPTPTSVASPIPSTTPTPPRATPMPGTVLYQADWSNGMTGWQQAFGWSSLDGMLVNDGSGDQYGSGWISSPYHPGVAGVRDYAVEAEIQVVHWPDFSQTGFGVVVRSGYQAGICNHGWGVSAKATVKTVDAYCFHNLGEFDFDPGTNWHTYRVEVRGNSVKLLIDGSTYIDVTDNTHLDGGDVGLWAGNYQVSVRSFKVIAQ